MSRLLIVTRPALVSGFHLAGVEAYGAGTVETAQKLVTGWLEIGESGLLAVDEKLLAEFTPAFRRRLEAAPYLPCVALPAGDEAGREGAIWHETAELIRRTVGFQITFPGERS
jgi:vacuolar-type H+-ATPase subunit F/Vma7